MIDYWRRWIADGEASRAVLTNLGEKMSDEEVDELLKAVDTSSGEINYTGIYLLRSARFFIFVSVASSS